MPIFSTRRDRQRDPPQERPEPQEHPLRSRWQHVLQEYQRERAQPQPDRELRSRSEIVRSEWDRVLEGYQQERRAPTGPIGATLTTGREGQEEPPTLTGRERREPFSRRSGRNPGTFPVP